MTPKTAPQARDSLYPFVSTHLQTQVLQKERTPCDCAAAKGRQHALSVGGRTLEKLPTAGSLPACFRVEFILEGLGLNVRCGVSDLNA